MTGDLTRDEQAELVKLYETVSESVNRLPAGEVRDGLVRLQAATATLLDLVPLPAPPERRRRQRVC